MCVTYSNDKEDLEEDSNLASNAWGWAWLATLFFGLLLESHGTGPGLIRD